MKTVPFVLETDITYPVHLDYVLYLPEDYTSDETYPVLLYLHGAGERSDELQGVKTTGIPAMLEGGENLPFIVIAPQCPANDTWQTLTLDVMLLLDTIMSDYAVDRNRVYITGYSMGGYATWDLLRQYPEKFTAGVPICGGLHHLIDLEMTAETIKTIPIWTFHGAKDDIVNISETQRVVDALEKVDGDITLTVYPEGTHDVWTETYANQDVYSWLLDYTLAEE